MCGQVTHAIATICTAEFEIVSRGRSQSRCNYFCAPQDIPHALYGDLMASVTHGPLRWPCICEISPLMRPPLSDRGLICDVFSGTFGIHVSNEEQLRVPRSPGLVKRELEMASHPKSKEDDPHSKRITLDTIEWHRCLQELAKLRQHETSAVSDAATMSNVKLA